MANLGRNQPSNEPTNERREIESCVPGRSAGSMQVNYKYLKALVETFTPEEVRSARRKADGGRKRS
jgi:hypothetical protein